MESVVVGSAVQPHHWQDYPRAVLLIPTPAQVRKAAKSFKWYTGQGADKLAPRSLSLLSDATLDDGPQVKEVHGHQIIGSPRGLTDASMSRAVAVRKSQSLA